MHTTTDACWKLIILIYLIILPCELLIRRVTCELVESPEIDTMIIHACYVAIIKHKQLHINYTFACNM